VRTTFRHHYERPSDDDIDAALVNATVVLDTNILLGLYRVSPELQKTRLSVLGKIDDRLFIPHQVGVEFHRNRRTVVKGISDAYTDLDAAITRVRKSVKDFGGKNRYDESTKRVRELVEPALDEVLEGLKELAEEDAHRIDLRQDHVLDALEELLEGKIGKAPSPKKLARRVQEFTAVRVPLSLPPCYADRSKMVEHGPAAAAGDYLLWREVLTMAKHDETDVVLITDDAKPDWWALGRESGLPTVPHPLLVSEFREKTGQAYYQLSSHELLKRATALEVDVSEENLVEERDLFTERINLAASATFSMEAVRGVLAESARQASANFSPEAVRGVLAESARQASANYSPDALQNALAAAAALNAAVLASRAGVTPGLDTASALKSLAWDPGDDPADPSDGVQ